MPTFDPSRGDTISWRVVGLLTGVPFGENFDDSVDAAVSFEDVARDIEADGEINDRVVLYRTKKQPGIRSYTDTYRTVIKSPKGLIRVSMYAPRTWQDAERVKERQRERDRDARKRRKERKGY